MGIEEYINKVIQGDCLEILKDIPDKSIDMVLTDPPYNISQKNGISRVYRSGKRGDINYDYGEWDNRSRDEFLEFTKFWLNESCRVLKNGGTIISFFNKEDISFLGWKAKKLDIRTRTIFTWCKTNPVPSFRKVNYLSATEFIWVGSKGTKNWTFNFGQQKEMKNYFISPNASSYGKTNHPTEKPLKLISIFLRIHSKEDDLILDPFAGSGTTCVAAKMLGRRYIGIEISPEYCEIANKRLENTVRQGEM